MKLSTTFLVFCVALLSDSGEFPWDLASPMEGPAFGMGFFLAPIPAGFGPIRPLLCPRLLAVALLAGIYRGIQMLLCFSLQWFPPFSAAFKAYCLSYPAFELALTHAHSASLHLPALA